MAEETEGMSNGEMKMDLCLTENLVLKCLQYDSLMQRFVFSP